MYLVEGTPWSWEQELLAAVLAAGPGAKASHRAGSRLWNMVDDAPLEITVPRGRTPELWAGVIVHQSSNHQQLFHRDRIPVVSPMQALLGLAEMADVFAVVEAMDRAAVDRRFSVATLEWHLAASARRGRPGVRTLQAALDVQALLDSPPEGLLEPRFARLTKKADLPRAVFQHPVGRYRIDFAYPDLLLAIEVDGYGKRSTRRAFQSDLDRQNELVARGWTMLRFTWNDVVRRPDHVARLIRDAIGRAQSGMAS